MAFQLFNMPEDKPKQTKKDSFSKAKIKKGETIETLIQTAQQLVEEKLGKYKDTSKCVISKEELEAFFNEVPDDSLMGIDTETTGLNTFTDELVGISLCNGIQALYLPINHKSVVTRTRLSNELQMSPDVVKEVFDKVFREKHYKWIYHNAKFDLAVMRTFFGYQLPDPYWDTMLGGQLLKQDEEHNLKYLYNTYIAEEDEGVNRFDKLFQRNNI